MLKKISVLILFTIASVLCTPLLAEVVSTEHARQIANTFLTLDNEWHGENDATIRLVEYNNTPAYYVIEYSAGGWAIVSAQSTSNPIIGYNTKGEYAAPEPMKQLLDINAQAIVARAQEKTTVEHKEWKRIRERKAPQEDINTTPDVAPLIKINLDQSAPFNSYCPEIDGEKCLVGCVAVAMTQALMVQRYPHAPQGKHSYSYGESTGDGAGHSINYDKERPYDWDAMYNGNNDEIARLAFHCGVSVDMMYSLTASGTVTELVATALPRNFGYDANVIRYVKKTSDIDKWLKTILGELSEGRAVVYRGQSGSGGHCWNVDGWKQSTQMVHCNWGWGGIGNGYFNINNMTDSYQGIGFQAGHSAVVGIGAPTTTPYDVLLSNTQFLLGTEPGTVLADVKVLCGDKEAAYSYELYSRKDNDGNIVSPYKIENNQLITTETITNDNTFKYIYIKVTNTNNGKSYEKEFKIYITTQDAREIEGTYTATAKGGSEYRNNEEWQVNITVDENDPYKVWLQPLCYFKNLEAQHINPVYATYDATKRELTMPLGQKMFKRSGFNIVNAISYDGKNISTTGDVVLKVYVSDTKKEISIDPLYILGAADVNKNNEWQQSLNQYRLTQEKAPLLDVELSTTDFYSDVAVGAPLADVIVTTQNPKAVISYEVFGPKDKDLNYTQSPYDIVDGTLVSTEPITDSDMFKYVTIRVTDTHTGEWINKGFYINVISLTPGTIAGEYYAYANSSFKDFPNEEWKVSITVDENDNNKLWITPVCKIHNIAVEDIKPAYATFDGVNSTIEMPLGQTLYTDNDKYNLIAATSTNSAAAPNTTGIAQMSVYKNGDAIEIVFANDYTFGVGNAVDDSWWFQALHDIVYSNREIVVYKYIYYNIINETDKQVEVTYKGVSRDHYSGEYYSLMEIPTTIEYKENSYTVTGIGKDAFYNSGELYAIALPESITEIGEEAFAMCDRLSQLDILATTPPVIYANTFDGVNRTIPVNVPKGCGEAYRNAPYWSEFTNINEDSSVEDVLCNTTIKVGTYNGHITIVGAKDDAVVNIYSLCGMLLHHTTVEKANQIELSQGIYLVQVDGTTHKVVI